MQTVLRAFEARDRNLLEDNLWRVSFWSCASVLVMVCVALTQVNKELKHPRVIYLMFMGVTSLRIFKAAQRHTVSISVHRSTLSVNCLKIRGESTHRKLCCSKTRWGTKRSPHSWYLFILRSITCNWLCVNTRLHGLHPYRSNKSTSLGDEG